MQEQLVIKLESWIKEEIQKINGSVNEDSLYIVHCKKVQPNERFTVYDKEDNKIVDTTIDEVLRDVDVPTKKGWVKKKQNVWEEYPLDNNDKRKRIELYKNYYPEWFRSFEISYPEMGHKGFNDYYELFMKELDNYKQKIK